MKVLLSLVLCLAWTPNLWSQEQKGIHVTGEGRVKVVPDQIEFRIGGEFEGKDVAALKGRSDALMRKLLADTKAFGIDSKDIQSENVRISRSYGDEGKPGDRNYISNAELRILMRDVGKFDALVEKLFASGANKMSELTPGSTKLDALRDEARVLAIADAKQRARKIAKEFKVDLGKVRSVVETRIEGNTFLYRSSAMSPKMDAAPTVALGEMEQGVNVEVIFDID